MILIIIIYIFIINYFHFGCFFRLISEIPCPTCGMTRAFFNLFQLNVNGYIYYNIMAIPVAIAVVLLIHYHIINKKIRGYFLIISSLILLINLIYYCYRLINILIP